MLYDIDDVKRIVEEKRIKFRNTLLALAFLIAVSVGVMLLYPETTVVFICVVVIISAVSYAAKFLSENKPLILFSKGLRGTNIKEHEYVTAGTRITRYGGISYRYIPSRHLGDVYIRRDDGEVVAVCHLPKKHLDIYEIGDELLIFPGTRYPIVVGRDASEIPCPICGYVNSMKNDKCESCGLKITKNVKY